MYSTNIRRCRHASDHFTSPTFGRSIVVCTIFGRYALRIVRVCLLPISNSRLHAMAFELTLRRTALRVVPFAMHAH